MHEPIYTHRRTHDAHEQAASLSAWEQRYEQISAGRFDGLLEDARLGPVQVFHERASTAVFQQGLPRPGTVTLASMQATGAPGWVCGHRLDEERGFVMPAGGEFELRSAPSMDLLAVCIDRAHLEQLSEQLGVAGRPPGRGGPGGLSLLLRSDFDPARFRALAQGALEAVRDRPALFAQPAALRMLSLSLSQAVLEGLVPSRLDAAPPPSAAARRRIVARSREFMQANAGEVVTVPQLCRAAGVSRRALQYAFEDVMGLSPVTCLRVMRLNGVRADLQRGAAGSVGDTAARWGFWHLSRFAADYRALFGELPSATRGRALPRAESG